MGEGDHRFDVVFQQLVEHVVVELQPLFIRLGFVTLREDAGPGDRGAEAFEAHLGEQFDVFFVATVEVDGFVVRVVFSRFDRWVISRGTPCAPPVNTSQMLGPLPP